MYKIHGKLWGDGIINSLICIFISTVQEMFRWKLRKFKISYLPYFLSDLHQIFTVLFEMCYTFYCLNLNLDWISPFRCMLFRPAYYKYTDIYVTSTVHVSFIILIGNHWLCCRHMLSFDEFSWLVRCVWKRIVMSRIFVQIRLDTGQVNFHLQKTKNHELKAI